MRMKSIAVAAALATMLLAALLAPASAASAQPAPAGIAPATVTTSVAEPAGENWYFYAYYDDLDTCVSMGVLWVNTGLWLKYRCQWTPALLLYSLQYQPR